MQLRTLPYTEAYRRDLARAGGRLRFGGDDGSWLLLAKVLELLVGSARMAPKGLFEAWKAARAQVAASPTSQPSTHTDRIVRELDAVIAQLGRDGDMSALGVVVDRNVDKMIEAHAYELAHTVLATAMEIVPPSSPERLGLLIRDARVSLRLGSVEAAQHVYAEAARSLGRASRSTRRRLLDLSREIEQAKGHSDEG